MAIYVHSKELTQEFRVSHRRAVVRERSRRRRERETKPRDISVADLDTQLDRAIAKDDN